MLAHRLRRWSSIETTLAQYLLFAGLYDNTGPVMQQPAWLGYRLVWIDQLTSSANLRMGTQT